MRTSKRTRQSDQNGLRAGRLRVGKTGLTLLLLISAGLFATTSTGTIKGTVETEAGAGIQGAKVIVRVPDGQVVATASTDDRGRFQLSSIPAGPYTVGVEFAGQMEASPQSVEVKDGETAELNFIGRDSHAGSTGKSGLLGPVSFYNHSGYRQGQLQNPSGGGGYSNAASAQAVKMLQQYLTVPRSPAATGGPEAGGKARGYGYSQEAELEQSGKALLAQREYARATKVFEKATALYPPSEHLQMGLGLSLYGAGKYPAAVSALSEAARLAPDDSAPVVMLSEALQFAPDVAAAGMVKKFSNLHPENAQGHYAYGVSLWSDFRAHRNPTALANAQAEFEKAIALDPTDAASHVQLGMIYDEQKATDRAVREYVTALHLNPQLATAHYRLAQDYERLGKKGKAAAELALYEKLRGHTSR